MDIEKNVELIPGADKIKIKLQIILNKNYGFQKLCLIEKMISDSSFEKFEEDLTAKEVANFKFAPITSSEVERTFSKFKYFLRDNRRSFKIDNVRILVLILEILSANRNLDYLRF